ncbi:putative solute:sodium symporter small subunit [Geomicrobium halophilum]|uniref:Putative solute:sodium symporter small subunit n=1 Tax=Geomicrobium halophilum TaxID=549000 RepID=A0A841PUZ4_9BACL|nr:sodium/substrate symporter small subunit [Geomicrobium halophilum]MBB6451544.1 putative solute:sodium symporter small subunit [Geomicrobium halophilum]
MRKVDRKHVEAYFKIRTLMIVVFLFIAFLVSFGAAFFAEYFQQFTFLGMPFHYYMGAQGSVFMFIVLLFLNAVISDRIDKKFGIDEGKNVRISSGKTVNH